MQLKTLKSAPLAGKIVLLRVAYETPLKEQNGQLAVTDDTRLCASLSTIRYLLKKNCKIVLLSYFGRPEGKERKYQLDPQAKRLSQLLGKKVIKLNDCIGPEVEEFVSKMRPKDVVLLENTRFHPEEKKNDVNFAKQLAHLGEVFINDAFAQSYEPHASTTAITKFLPSYAGLLMEKEITELSKAITKPKRPLVVIIGGAKISNKIKAIDSLIQKADYVLLGGALANTILTAQGIQVGKSLIEKDYIDIAKKLPITNLKLKIPVDVVVATKTLTPQNVNRPVGAVKKDESILDIGPDTVDLYKKVIKSAKTIIWNGPMGKYEIKQFSYGTIKIAQAIASARAKTYVGGGETVDCLNELKLASKIDFVSTAGGAMLKFLEGKTLEPLKPLIKK